jgi:hypothetical protein
MSNSLLHGFGFHLVQCIDGSAKQQCTCHMTWHMTLPHDLPCMCINNMLKNMLKPSDLLHQITKQTSCWWVISDLIWSLFVESVELKTNHLFWFDSLDVYSFCQNCPWAIHRKIPGDYHAENNWQNSAKLGLFPRSRIVSAGGQDSNQVRSPNRTQWNSMRERRLDTVL